MACIFGDVTKIDTSGASAETARQDNLKVLGVDASHKMAENDLSRMNRYKDIITKVGNDLEMDPAVICGIISRESRAGSVLEDGWCPNRYGFGLMQVDRRYYPEPEKTGEWNSEEHINQGTEILIGFIKKIQAKFPSWSKEQQFKGGISAYNAGPGNVQTYEGMDIGTQGDDYANDVVARAQWFKMNGF